jgi:hypothetical protein
MAGTALLAASVATLAMPARAFAQAADYRPESTDWNGLSEFCALARGMGWNPMVVSTLGWDDLGPNDVLFIVYPRRPLDGERLLDWVRDGGHAVVADDFGDGQAALAAFGLQRIPARAATAPTYQSHDHMPIAQVADASSPLARGVGSLVTNHPAAFAWPPQDAPGSPDAVFTTDPSEAIVVDEPVGSGRLVALADPSVLINEMQLIPEDAAFATALLRSLRPVAGAASPGASATNDDNDGANEDGVAGAESTATDSRPRLLLVIEGFAESGEPSAANLLDDPSRGVRSVQATTDAFNRWLEGLSDYVARSRWLLAVAFLLLAAAGLALLRVTPWGTRHSPDPNWGRVDLQGPFLRTDPVLSAAAILREELERRLLKLGVPIADLRDATRGPRLAQDAASQVSGHAAGLLAAEVVVGLTGIPTDRFAARPRRVSRRALNRILTKAQNLFTLLDLEQG